MLNEEQVELSKHRLNKAKDSLEQAKVLLEHKMFDGSINRSYYAIFYSIRSILSLVNLDSSKHSGVLSMFDRYFVKTGLFEKKFSKIAHTGFDVRQDSDYEDFYILEEKEASSQFLGAEEFVREVEFKRMQFVNEEISLPDIS